ncbi:transcription termination/antitermination protein NusG [Pleomorphomonas koreensis]|uniref:transcription termination/antitermination protein NusG n=1 Tax=Pleomorphomonas koreensis TaxID=257440 RepID=UPI00047AD0F8|nr:transcription termination/antitermination NusG family protein [Pleomorphomonas koreensis]
MKSAAAIIPVNTETLLRACQSDVYDYDWYVIHTNPRCEDRAASGLRARGFMVYAPQEVVWKTIRKRKGKCSKRARVHRPAFPRYLFVGMKAMDWELIHRCDGVAGIVCMDDTPVRISSHEIADLMAAEDMGCFDFAVDAQQVMVGDRVMLTHGWFDGYKATVKRVEGKSEETKRVTVEVDLLGKATPTVVPIDMIRRLA